MFEVLIFTVTSFLIGLSGAMAPGPLLTVAVSDSLRNGFRVGPLLVAGHVIGEALVVALILLGLGYMISSDATSAAIGIFGGAVLVWSGISGFRKSEIGENSLGKQNPLLKSTVLKGTVISFSNPYFFIWWGAVGASLIYRGFEVAGLAGFLGFLIGHWGSDFLWYSLVTFLSSRGSLDVDGGVYRVVMLLCSGFLVAAGVYFVAEGLGSLIYGLI